MLLIGIDWAQHKHDVVLMDPSGTLIRRMTLTHGADDLQELGQVIAEHEPAPQQVRVGVELHNGALLAWLLEQQYVVYGINPKSSQKARDLYRPAGAKDDRGDAFILAEMIRTDAGRLRPVRDDSPLTQKLKMLVALRASRVEERADYCKRLRAILNEWSPEVSKLCGDLIRIAWQRDLIQQFPLHAELADAHGNRVRAFCRRHRLGEKTRQRIDQTRHAATLPIPEARRSILKMEILYLIGQIERIGKDIDEIEAQLDQCIAEHPDAFIFQSLPVRGTATTAALLSLWGENRDQAPLWSAVAARCGMAPVTVASGRCRRVRYRRACDNLARRAMQFFAFNTAFTDDTWAAQYYQAKRQAGAAHFTALRCLAQRWIKIIDKLWKQRVPYDEQFHQARRQQRLSAITCA